MFSNHSPDWDIIITSYVSVANQNQQITISYTSLWVYTAAQITATTSSKLETVFYLMTKLRSVQQYIIMINHTINHSNQKQQKLIFNSVIHCEEC